MALPKNAQRLAEILLKAGVVDDLQLRSASARIENWGGRLPRVLAELGLADEDAMTAAIGKALGFPVTHLGSILRDNMAMSKLEARFCEEHVVFPVSLRDKVMTLAMVDPADLGTIDAVKSKAGTTRVLALLSSETEIKNAIAKHYHGKETQEVSNRARKAVTREESGAEEKFEVDMSKPPVPSERVNTQEVLRRSAGQAFTQQDLARLEAVRVTQAKTGSILRAVHQLLTEKGFAR